MRDSVVPRSPLTAQLAAILVLLGIATFINYVDRGNLSIAAPMLKDELGISAARLGLLLSAFFWSYACCQPFAGWLVDRLDVNWVFAGGFLLWSVATAATGAVHTFAALFALRLLLGIGESVAYPSYSRIIATNFPEEHRGTANGAVSTGLVLGPGFGMLLGGVLMAKYGWRPFFIVLGLGSLLWLIPWLRFKPQRRAGGTLNSDAPSLAEFVRLRSAWGTCIGLFCSNYLSYFLITWLPFYLVRERHFTMDDMAKIGGAMYLAGAVFATAAGWVSDRWIAAGATPTRVRKTIVGGGLMVSGIAVGGSAFCGPALSVGLLVLGMIGFGILSSNIWAITQSLAGPAAAGRWTGFQNFVGNLAGVVAPAVTGFVVDRTGHFSWAFLIMTGVALFGTMCWIFLVGPVEQVQWSERGTPSVATEAI
jgi:ACS family D-galactonate transporter-like MFS transporter